MHVEKTKIVLVVDEKLLEKSFETNVFMIFSLPLLNNLETQIQYHFK